MQHLQQMTGLIAPETDALAQLIGGQLAADGAMPVPLLTASAPLSDLDRIIVTSQQRFLASAAKLRAFEGPITVVLRAQDPAETEQQWRLGLELTQKAL